MLIYLSYIITYSSFVNQCPPFWDEESNVDVMYNVYILTENKKRPAITKDKPERGKKPWYRC